MSKCLFSQATVTAALNMCSRRYAHTAAVHHRVPSIKFTHGVRSIINSEMGQRSNVSIHPAVVALKAQTSGPSNAASQVNLPAVTTVTIGKYTTRVIRISENEYIPPSLSFDSTAMAMIELGGAMPDPPKPPKDAKGGAKKDGAKK